MKPNVLLIVLDAARRDALSPYARAADTPVIAELAARGHVLPRAYATSSWTLPSHTSLFSGLMPRSAGLASRPTERWRAFARCCSGSRSGCSR